MPWAAKGVSARLAARTRQRVSSLRLDAMAGRPRPRLGIARSATSSALIRGAAANREAQGRQGSRWQRAARAALDARGDVAAGEEDAAPRTAEGATGAPGAGDAEDDHGRAHSHRGGMAPLERSATMTGMRMREGSGRRPQGRVRSRSGDATAADGATRFDSDSDHREAMGAADIAEAWRAAASAGSDDGVADRADGGVELRRGMLWKRRDWRQHEWPERLFVLRRDRLEYYIPGRPEPKDVFPLGSIISVRRYRADDSNFPSTASAPTERILLASFMVRTTTATMLVSSLSAEESDAWVDDLNAAVQASLSGASKDLTSLFTVMRTVHFARRDAQRRKVIRALATLVNSRSERDTSIPWELDEAVTACPLCSRVFSKKLTGRRRHHCRLCGKVVCADCSKSRRSLDVSAPGQRLLEDGADEAVVDAAAAAAQAVAESTGGAGAPSPSLSAEHLSTPPRRSHAIGGVSASPGHRAHSHSARSLEHRLGEDPEWLHTSLDGRPPLTPPRTEGRKVFLTPFRKPRRVTSVRACDECEACVAAEEASDARSQAIENAQRNHPVVKFSSELTEAVGSLTETLRSGERLLAAVPAESSTGANGLARLRAAMASVRDDSEEERDAPGPRGAAAARRTPDGRPGHRNGANGGPGLSATRVASAADVARFFSARVALGEELERVKLFVRRSVDLPRESETEVRVAKNLQGLVLSRLQMLMPSVRLQMRLLRERVDGGTCGSDSDEDAVSEAASADEESGVGGSTALASHAGSAAPHDESTVVSLVSRLMIREIERGELDDASVRAVTRSVELVNEHAALFDPDQKRAIANTVLRTVARKRNNVAWASVLSFSDALVDEFMRVYRAEVPEDYDIGDSVSVAGESSMPRTWTHGSLSAIDVAYDIHPDSRISAGTSARDTSDDEGVMSDDDSGIARWIPRMAWLGMPDAAGDPVLPPWLCGKLFLGWEHELPTIGAPVPVMALPGGESDAAEAEWSMPWWFLLSNSREKPLKLAHCHQMHLPRGHGIALPKASYRLYELPPTLSRRVLTLEPKAMRAGKRALSHAFFGPRSSSTSVEPLSRVDESFSRSPASAAAAAMAANASAAAYGAVMSGVDAGHVVVDPTVTCSNCGQTLPMNLVEAHSRQCDGRRRASALELPAATDGSESASSAVASVTRASEVSTTDGRRPSVSSSAPDSPSAPAEASASPTASAAGRRGGSTTPASATPGSSDAALARAWFFMADDDKASENSADGAEERKDGLDDDGTSGESKDEGDDGRPAFRKWLEEAPGDAEQDATGVSEAGVLFTKCSVCGAKVALDEVEVHSRTCAAPPTPSREVKASAKPSPILRDFRRSSTESQSPTAAAQPAPERQSSVEDGADGSNFLEESYVTLPRIGIGLSLQLPALGLLLAVLQGEAPGEEREERWDDFERRNGWLALEYQLLSHSRYWCKETFEVVRGLALHAAEAAPRSEAADFTDRRRPAALELLITMLLACDSLPTVQAEAVGDISDALAGSVRNVALWLRGPGVRTTVALLLHASPNTTPYRPGNWIMRTSLLQMLRTQLAYLVDEAANASSATGASARTRSVESLPEFAPLRDSIGTVMDVVLTEAATTSPAASEILQLLVTLILTEGSRSVLISAFRLVCDEYSAPLCLLASPVESIRISALQCLCVLLHIANSAEHREFAKSGRTHAMSKQLEKHPPSFYLCNALLGVVFDSYHPEGGMDDVGHSARHPSMSGSVSRARSFSNDSMGSDWSSGSGARGRGASPMHRQRLSTDFSETSDDDEHLQLNLSFGSVLEEVGISLDGPASPASTAAGAGRADGPLSPQDVAPGAVLRVWTEPGSPLRGGVGDRQGALMRGWSRTGLASPDRPPRTPRRKGSWRVASGGRLRPHPVDETRVLNAMCIEPLLTVLARSDDVELTSGILSALERAFDPDVSKASPLNMKAVLRIDSWAQWFHDFLSAKDSMLRARRMDASSADDVLLRDNRMMVVTQAVVHSIVRRLLVFDMFSTWQRRKPTMHLLRLVDADLFQITALDGVIRAFRRRGVLPLRKDDASNVVHNLQSLLSLANARFDLPADLCAAGVCLVHELTVHHPQESSAAKLPDVRDALLQRCLEGSARVAVQHSEADVTSAAAGLISVDAHTDALASLEPAFEAVAGSTFFRQAQGIARLFALFTVAGDCEIPQTSLQLGLGSLIGNLAFSSPEIRQELLDAVADDEVATQLMLALRLPEPPRKSGFLARVLRRGHAGKRGGGDGTLVIEDTGIVIVEAGSPMSSNPSGASGAGATDAAGAAGATDADRASRPGSSSSADGRLVAAPPLSDDDADSVAASVGSPRALGGGGGGSAAASTVENSQAIRNIPQFVEWFNAHARADKRAALRKHLAAKLAKVHASDRKGRAKAAALADTLRSRATAGYRKYKAAAVSKTEALLGKCATKMEAARHMGEAVAAMAAGVRAERRDTAQHAWRQLLLEG